MRQTVEHIHAAYNTARDVAIRELRHRIACVVFPAFILNLLNYLRVWLLRRGMDPQRAFILAEPLAALKAFEAQHEQGSPWLVHGQAHASIVCLSVKVFVAVPLVAIICLIHYCFFNSLPKLVKWVFSLQALMQTVVSGLEFL